MLKLKNRLWNFVYWVYSVKIFELLSSSWVSAIVSILFLIFFNGILMEWYAANFSGEYHQTGWQYVGMLILASVIIPVSFLVAIFIGFFSQIPRKKLFFWISICFFVIWVGPIWIRSFVLGIWRVSNFVFFSLMPE